MFDLTLEYEQLALEETPQAGSTGTALKGTSVNEQYLIEKEDGTRNTNGSRKLNALTPQHEEMIAMHLDGMRNKDIAEYFDVTDSTISIVLNDPLAQAIVQSARKENEGRFAALYGKVVDVIEDAVSPNESIDIRLKGASVYLKESGNTGTGEKETAEDVVQKIINLQINGDLVVQQGGG